MQGFNMGRYVPPDQEGLVTSGNRVLGIRAQKANADGVPIVRFEMPFAIWCDGCEKRTIGRDGKHHPVLVGQGVRFNAEKHRTGNYYTTPIFTFRMRHPACGTWLAIRTDPATTSYLVVEGARKRSEYEGDDDDNNNGGGEHASAGSEAARANAFDKLERTIAHRAVDTSLDAIHRIRDLARHTDRQWDDPYERNRALRAAFRTRRQARQQAAADDDGLRQRLGGLSADLPLLPASETDARIAALIEFGTTQNLAADAVPATPRDVVDRRNLARPLFDASRADVSGTPPAATLQTPSVAAPPTLLRSARNNTYAATTEVARRQEAVRQHLASTLAANTRMKTDPFVLALDRKRGPTGRGARAGGKAKPFPVKGAKRTKDAAVEQVPLPKRQRYEPAERTEDDGPAQTTRPGAAMALVNYDSD